MDKKERTSRKARREWINNQSGRTMTEEEFAQVQGMTHSEFQSPTKIKEFYNKVKKDNDGNI